MRSTGKGLAIFLVGLLFAIHPLHTEAVAWIAGRKDLLSTFFALLSLIAWVRYRGRSKQAYAWSIVMLLLSLLAKMMAVTLPVIFLLYDLLWERRKITREFFLDKLPHVLLSVIFGIVALGGKERILASLSPVETLLVAGKSVVFYLEKLLLPVHLSVLYPFQGMVSIAKPEFFLPLMIVLALFGLLVMLLRRAVSDTGAGKWAFGLLFFLIMLSPTLLHARKGEGIFFAVDRYAYLPSVGIALLLALLLQYIFDRYRPSGEALWIPVVIIVTAFTTLSVRQTFTWNSAETLYGNVLAIYPESVNARASLASIRRQQGDIQGAFDVLKEGLQYSDDSRLHLHAGYVYAANGDVTSAREQFEKVIAMDSQNPEPVFSIGSLLEQTGDPAGAAEKYRAAIALDSSYVVARVSLAQILMTQGKTLSEAEEQLRTALRWNPSAADAHVALAKILQKEGKREEALAHAQAALEIDEGNAEARNLVESLRQR